MHAEVTAVGERSCAVDLVIGKARFRVKYFESHRVDPLRDAREFAGKLGDAIKRELYVGPIQQETSAK